MLALNFFSMMQQMWAMGVDALFVMFLFAPVALVAGANLMYLVYSLFASLGGFFGV